MTLRHLVSFLGCLGAIATVVAQQPFSFLIDEKDVYALLPAEFICGPKVTEVSWSPSGLFLLATREVDASAAVKAIADLHGEPVVGEAVVEAQLVSWNMKRRRSEVLLKGPADQLTISSPQWLAGTDLFLLQVGRTPAPGAASAEPKLELLFGSPSSGRLSPVAGLTGKAALVNPATQRPLAFIELESANPAAGRSFQFVTRDGRAGSALTLPPKFWLDWADDGRTPIAMQIVRNAQTNRRQLHMFAVDPVTAKMGQELPTMPVAPKTRRVALRVLGGDLPVGPTESTMSVVTVMADGSGKKDGEPTFVTTDGEKGSVSSALSGVAYQHQGNLLVRSMERLDRAEFDRLMVRRKRAEAVSKAKQVATAMSIYSADADGAFVPSAGDWRGNVMPYIKNRKMLDSFVLTFGGGVPPGDKPSAEVVLGFVPGPGGRAVAYADGHVEWVPDP